ncbi:ribonuclease T2 activity [Seminavis robusta]|uniref:Ribonuclease T2 activity n=1 Tax=Seminavis robusta TaxID=568900 RepID=A0A9N8E6K2_9STRA|nr:ribonuclease T2 activity [Seminavis robusta]|eukprot:Sro675_g185500.1 ribonuclease T2 activity (327) ;mRNA; r:29008-30291
MEPRNNCSRHGWIATKRCINFSFLAAFFLPSVDATNLREALLSPALFDNGVKPWGFQKSRECFIWSKNRQPLTANFGRDLTLSSILLEDRLRGGSQEAAEDGDKDKEVDEEEEENDEQLDEDGEEEEEEDLEDDEDDLEEEEEEEPVGAELEESGEFDEPLVASPMLGLYATFGVMALSKKISLYDPTVVRVARFAFLGYLFLLQAFLLYVRIRAKAENDRTPIKLSNPVSNLIQQQLQGQDSTNAMMKNLASSFLSSESTNLEYDLKQAKGMQGGLLFNMCFMWFLHFKMEQIQPLMVTTVTGLINLVYSPLFQVYVLDEEEEEE